MSEFKMVALMIEDRTSCAREDCRCSVDVNDTTQMPVAAVVLTGSADVAGIVFCSPACATHTLTPHTPPHPTNADGGLACTVLMPPVTLHVDMAAGQRTLNPTDIAGQP